PRVGNQAFADYIDAHVASQVDGMMGLSRLNYRQDPVPLIPCRDWGFHHPSGEVHVQESGEWDSCAG
ncbi:uncharacterized protein FOMMEDRAFT_49670, partial [Fomitiporia mediterranea MF3/22]|uniref:uncharacterized protein n=1 Tax=Fomitiporia mediterranea (strain MF3/22) TaxID=694068 RepID=UPI0004408535